MAALRAVKDDDRSEDVGSSRGDSSIATAAASGDRRALLVSLREHIAKRLDEDVAPRDLASLSKRLVDIANEIAEIDAASGGDDVSDAAETPDEVWDPSS